MYEFEKWASSLPVSLLLSLSDIRRWITAATTTAAVTTTPVTVKYKKWFVCLKDCTSDKLSICVCADLNISKSFRYGTVQFVIVVGDLFFYVVRKLSEWFGISTVDRVHFAYIQFWVTFGMEREAIVLFCHWFKAS